MTSIRRPEANIAPDKADSLVVGSDGSTGTRHHPERGPSPIDSRADVNNSLFVNGSITEGEANAFWVPSALVEEEGKLQDKRKKLEEEESFQQPEALLSRDKFAQLDHLLSQTDMFSKFLAEQIKDLDVSLGQEPSGSASPKRKAPVKNKRSVKRRKVEPVDDKPTTSATRELLPLMQGELRDYQLKGVRWLISLYQNGLNGILADQMGLGKTVQTIGFLSHLKSKGVNGPFMIIGPLSTLPNWVSEFRRWCPTLVPLLYHGPREERTPMRLKYMVTGAKAKDFDFPVFITSYEVVLADSKYMQKVNWKYIVVDEGHRLKNMDCRLIRELKLIPANNRLLLSGTPLQNNLAELWSLLNFLMPEVFQSLADFEAWFDLKAVGQEGGDKAIVAAEQRNQVVSKLHNILKPFLLRRMKTDVEINLPNKSEIILYADMADTQIQLNQQLLDKTIMEQMAKLASKEGGNTASIGKLNNVLMQMRKNCNHPDLITSAFSSTILYPTPEELTEQCGKMKLLGRLTSRLHTKGHKVLIFSQMTKMLDLIESFYDQQGHRACRIDGSIKLEQRQQNIQDFNEDPNTWLFLLSTRAGGLGINLTGADTVIIYDSDWNPHQDLQAMDRCHRIGQTKPVLVFRLATAHSVEGKMLKRAADKMVLERLVIRKGFFKDKDEEGSKSTSVSAAELLELLRADYCKDDVPQSGVIDDAMLDKLLDRSHLVQDKPAPYPLSGIGYEVVQGTGESSLLSGVE